MKNLLLVFPLAALLSCGGAVNKTANDSIALFDTIGEDDEDLDLNGLPKYLNSVAGHDERDFIVGKFDGVHEDTLFVYTKKCVECDEEDSIKFYAMSKSKRLPAIELFGYPDPDFQPKLVCEGDLDGNGTCEWGYLHTWLTSQWRTYRVYTLVNGKWRFLIDNWDLLDTHSFFRSSGLEVIEPGPRKGTVKVNACNQYDFEIKDTIIRPSYARITKDNQ